MQINPEIELLQELWDNVKDYVPKKERLIVAETMVRIFDETHGLEGIESHINEMDGVLKAAVVTHYDLIDDDGDDEDWEV